MGFTGLKRVHHVNHMIPDRSTREERKKELHELANHPEKSGRSGGLPFVENLHWVICSIDSKWNHKMWSIFWRSFETVCERSRVWNQDEGFKQKPLLKHAKGQRIFSIGEPFKRQRSNDALIVHLQQNLSESLLARVTRTELLGILTFNELGRVARKIHKNFCLSIEIFNLKTLLSTKRFACSNTIDAHLNRNQKNSVDLFTNQFWMKRNLLDSRESKFKRYQMWFGDCSST